jgi:hypothetical protein
VIKFILNIVKKLKAFMTGKLKMKGQIMAIYRLYSVWIDTAFIKKRAPELPFVTELLFESVRNFWIIYFKVIFSFLKLILSYFQFFKNYLKVIFIFL